MKFALLGDDPVVLPLVRAIVEHPEHALARAASLGRLEAEILLLSPATKIVGGWDELPTGELAAVIVCGAADTIAEPAKQLAAAGRPLVVFPQGTWDTELIYELSLQRDDTGVKLLPMCPLWEQPLFDDVPLRARQDEPGSTAAVEPEQPGILHLRCEQELQVAEGQELTDKAIRRYLLPDVGLLRRLGGEYYQVTAVQSATPTGGVVLGTVTLTGENLPDAIWTIRPVSTASRWQLTITRAEGASVYERRGEDGNIQPINEPEPPFNPGKSALEFVERGLSQADARPDWTDLTRDFEVLDAVRRSLGRRRTIDLHFETTSERSLFKTQMTALGCGLLLFTMFALVAMLILGSVLDPRSRVETTAHTAETIFHAEEFQPESPRLNPKGESHWNRVASARRDSAVPILVEKTADEALSARRREQLTARLEQEGIANPGQRVEVYALEGPWFETLMKIARFLVFLPLFVFLGLQSLLWITRTSQSHRKNEKKS